MSAYLSNKHFYSQVIPLVFPQVLTERLSIRFSLVETYLKLIV